VPDPREAVPETPQPIGRLTAAPTATATGMLSEEGALDASDEQIVDHLPLSTPRPPVRAATRCVRKQSAPSTDERNV
jgi:hypothetical protein